jgi:hypothetical protein
LALDAAILEATTLGMTSPILDKAIEQKRRLCVERDINEAIHNEDLVALKQAVFSAEHMEFDPAGLASAKEAYEALCTVQRPGIREDLFTACAHRDPTILEICIQQAQACNLEQPLIQQAQKIMEEAQKFDKRASVAKVRRSTRTVLNTVKNLGMSSRLRQMMEKHVAETQVTPSSEPPSPQNAPPGSDFDPASPPEGSLYAGSRSATPLDIHGLVEGAPKMSGVAQDGQVGRRRPSDVHVTDDGTAVLRADRK